MPEPDEESAGRDGVKKRERRERTARPPMPVHGRSLEAVMNAMRKRAAAGKKKSTSPKSRP